MENISKSCLKGPIAYFIGLFFYMIGVKPANPIGMLGIYMVSYFITKDPTLTINYTFFLRPILVFFTTFGNPLSGFLEKKIGFRLTILLASVLIYVGSLLNFFLDTFISSIFCFILFGLGLGFSGLTTKIAIAFFPKKRGLIIALVSLIGNLFLSGYYLLGEKIINPQGQQLDKTTNTYPLSISVRYKYYLLLSGSSVVFGTVVFLVITLRISFQEILRKSKKIENVSELEKSKETKLLEVKEEDKEIIKKEDIEIVTKEEINKIDHIKNKQYFSDLKQIFKSWKLWNLFLLSVFLCFLPFLILNTYRPIWEKKMKNVDALRYVSTVGGSVGALFAPLWGILSDKYEIRILVIIDCIALGINGIIYILAIEYLSITAFSISIILNVVLASGVNVFYIYHVSKIFELTYFMEVSGFIGFTIGILNILCAVFEFIILEYLKVQGNLPFYICFGVGVLFSFISLIFSAQLSNEKFDFSTKNEITKEIETIGEVLDEGIDDKK